MGEGEEGDEDESGGGGSGMAEGEEATGPTGAVRVTTALHEAATAGQEEV